MWGWGDDFDSERKMYWEVLAGHWCCNAMLDWNGAIQRTTTNTDNNGRNGSLFRNLECSVFTLSPCYDVILLTCCLSDQVSAVCTPVTNTVHCYGLCTLWCCQLEITQSTAATSQSVPAPPSSLVVILRVPPPGGVLTPRADISHRNV